MGIGDSPFAIGHRPFADSQGCFNQQFCFRARNENVGVYFKLQAKKFLDPNNISHRLALFSPAEQCLKAIHLIVIEWELRMSIKPGAILLKCVSQQHLRIKTRRIAPGGSQTMSGCFQNIQQEI